MCAHAHTQVEVTAGITTGALQLAETVSGDTHDFTVTDTQVMAVVGVWG